MADAHEPGSSGQLTGWKEVAGFLKRSVRTVQRWERDLGLPVHRIRTSDGGGPVFAWPHELREWMVRQERVLAADDARELADENGSNGSPDEVTDPLEAGLAPGAVPDPEVLGWRRQPVPLLVVGLTAVALAVSTGLALWMGSTPQVLPAVVKGSSFYVTTTRDILAIDAVSLTELGRVTIPAKERFAVIVDSTISSDGTTLVLVTDRSPGIALFDLEAGLVKAWYAAGVPRVRRARLTRDGTRLVMVTRSGTLRMLDAASGDWITDRMLGEELHDLWEDPKTGAFFVPSRDGNALFVLSRSADVLRRIPIGDGPHDIVADADTGRAYVSNERDGTVVCLDLESGSVLGTAKVQSHPLALALAPDGRTVFVANRDSMSVSAVDTARCKVRDTLADAVPQDRPGDIAADPTGRRLYVAAFELPVIVAFELDGLSIRRLTEVRISDSVTGLNALPPSALSVNSQSAQKR